MRTNCGEKVIPWFLIYSMLTYCPHLEVEMMVAGSLSWAPPKTHPTSVPLMGLGPTLGGTVCGTWQFPLHFLVSALAHPQRECHKRCARGACLGVIS